mmetsp:Transcript_42311/g.64895  ORF Transcript_42311/g.64895 Transcript_42311/m.64895 type:complete len:131 (-) Transcript_42311:766-1158(-)
MLLIPILAILVNIKSILIMLGQEELRAHYAQVYILAYLPGLIIGYLSDCQRRFLNNFGKNRISFISGTIAMVFHGFWCYIFIIKMDLGIIGTGYANAVTSILTFVILFVYTLKQEDIQEGVFWPDRRVFQ